MELTRLEREILGHRLEVPDCIEEALNDGSGHESFAPEDIDHVCELLLGEQFQEALDSSQRITTEVLIDCVEGSTYLATMSCESNRRVSCAIKAAEHLARKVEKFLGLERRLEVGG